MTCLVHRGEESDRDVVLRTLRKQGLSAAEESTEGEPDLCPLCFAELWNRVQDLEDRVRLLKAVLQRGTWDEVTEARLKYGPQSSPARECGHRRLFLSTLTVQRCTRMFGHREEHGDERGFEWRRGG